MTRKYVQCVLLLTCLFAIWTVAAQEMNTTQIIEEAIRYQNLGLAYLEESQPSKAVEAFTALVELLPDEAIGYGNLAVAYLRLQQADTAEEWVKRGIAVVPIDSQLHFILSEVYQLQGQSELAVAAMKDAVRLAPDELEFRYKLVRHYLGQRNNPEAQQEAVRHLQELHTRSPVNIVVLLKLTQGLLTQEQLEAAENLSQALMRLLGDTDPEKLTYLTQGIDAIKQGDLKLASRNVRIFENLHRASPRYQQGIGELVTDILGHPIETFSPGFKARIAAKQSPPIDVEFVDVTEEIGLANVERVPTDAADISLIDYDGDGNLDLYVTPPGALFQNTGGQFKAVPQFSAAAQGISNPHPTAIADLDKDGTQDFLLQTDTEIVVFRMEASGEWRAASLVQYEQRETQTRLLHPVDFDHDGDLDLFAAGTAMYRNNSDDQNNSDETFTDVGDQTFVSTDAGDVSLAQEVLSADFDDDGDIDIFVTHRETGCTLYDNLRQGRLRAVSSETGDSTGCPLYRRGLLATTTTTGTSISSWQQLIASITTEIPERDVSSDALGPEAGVEALPPTFLRNIDYDNDGFLDLWVGGKAGMFLFRNDGAGKFNEPYPFMESSALTGEVLLKNAIAGAIGDYDNDGDLDLFFVNVDGQLRALQNNGGNQNNWIQVRLEGITAGDNKVNRDAIGSKLEVKVGDLYQLRYVSEQVSHFGLGAFETAGMSSGSSGQTVCRRMSLPRKRDNAFSRNRY